MLPQDNNALKAGGIALAPYATLWAALASQFAVQIGTPFLHQPLAVNTQAEYIHLLPSVLQKEIQLTACGYSFIVLNKQVNTFCL